MLEYTFHILLIILLICAYSERLWRAPMAKKLKFILSNWSILTIKVMATQITPENRSFPTATSVWARRAALRAAPVKETPQETPIVPETVESQPEPVNLASAFEAEASDDTGFVSPSAKNHAANLARMERQATRAALPRAPRMIQPKQAVQPQPKHHVAISPAPSREKVMAEIEAKLKVADVPAAPVAAAAAPAVAEKQPNTYTVVFDGKVTAGLTYERLHKATKADLVTAQEMVYNQFIEAFEYALKNDGLLQCVDHLAGRFQTRKFVDGKPIVAGEHTFLMSDVIKEQYWVRKTRKTLNEIEPRLHVSFYYDHRTSKGVLSMKKA